MHYLMVLVNLSIGNMLGGTLGDSWRLFQAAFIPVFVMIYFTFVIRSVFSGVISLRGYKKITSLLFLYVLVGAVAAKITFGQPLGYGLLVQRDIFLSTGVIVLSFMLSRSSDPLLAYWRTLMLSFLGVAVIDVVWENLYSGGNYRSAALVNAGFRDAGRYVIDETPFVFLFISAFVMLYKRIKPIFSFALLAISVYFYVEFHQGRSLFFSVFFVLFLFIASSWYSRFSLSVAIGGGILVAFLGFVFYESESDLLLYFINPVLALLGRGIHGDYSMDSRASQFEIAWEYITRSPILGSGYLSNVWDGGFRDALGYFYPADLGIIGVQFTHGAIGLGIVLYSLVVMARECRWRLSDNHMLISLKLMLLYMIIQCLIRGYYMVHVGQMLAFLMVLEREAGTWRR